ncbi:MAG: bacillithiol system redox-active protein YtxJ [Bacteroidetes bacterium]|nr:bacillithiol system redox-active protein YtxJ [Bacteroidota bacterium]
MNWKNLNDMAGWRLIQSSSFSRFQVVFKHSTRCSISSMAKARIEKQLLPEDEFYLLDLLNHRDISNAIAQDLEVTHESPQILVIKDGACVYHASHSEIEYEEVKEVLMG